MIIRLATLADLETLLTFEQGIVEAERPFNPTLKEGQISYYDLKELIESNDAEVVVVEVENNVVASGYGLIKPAKTYFKHSRYVHLGFMFVNTEYRGQGINKLIVNKLSEWAESKNIDEVRLEVYEDNDSAIKAYEKVGFSKLLVEMRMNLSENKKN